MAKIINLNRARKEKARAAQRVRADTNAVKFGRTKAEKRLEAMKSEVANRHLDGAKVEDD